MEVFLGIVCGICFAIFITRNLFKGPIKQETILSKMKEKEDRHNRVKQEWLERFAPKHVEG